MGTLAVVLGVVAFGLVGILVLLGAGLILLCAELWRDAARSASRRDALTGAVAEAKSQLELAGAEVAALRQAADASELLQGRVGELELANASLRAQLASPALTPQQFIVSIFNQLTLVDMTNHTPAKPSPSDFCSVPTMSPARPGSARSPRPAAR